MCESLHECSEAFSSVSFLLSSALEGGRLNRFSRHRWDVAHNMLALGELLGLAAEEQRN